VRTYVTELSKKSSLLCVSAREYRVKVAKFHGFTNTKQRVDFNSTHFGLNTTLAGEVYDLIQVNARNQARPYLERNTQHRAS
ncbi:MAG: hypothetical protein OXT06_18895, partial [Rhodospirillaceae bacterium]|nr:hypothetical protein [Rhodospirillaceae bacterium]